MFSRTDPFETLLGLQRALDRATGTDFLGWGPAQRSVYPPINVFKTDDGYVLETEIPGLKKEDIHIDANQDQVRIYGERRPDFSSSEVSLHRTERPFGRFDRSIKLPFAVDPKSATASYEAGILTVTLKEPESAKPQKIAIK